MGNAITAEILGNNLLISVNGMNNISYGLNYFNNNPNDVIARKRRIASCFEDYIMNHYGDL